MQLANATKESETGTALRREVEILTAALANAEQSAQQQAKALEQALTEIERLRAEVTRLAKERQTMDQFNTYSIYNLQQLDPSKTELKHTSSVRRKSGLNREAPIVDVAKLGVFFEDLLKGSPSEKQEARIAIYSLLNAHNSQLKLIYRWYMAHSMYRTERASFFLSPNQFRLLIKHAKCSLDVSNEIGTILKQARQLRDSEGKITAELEGIDLRGFVEALVRISDIQYRTLPGALADKVTKFFAKNIPLLEQFKSDGFRAEIMSLDAVQAVLRSHKTTLQGMFRKKGREDASKGQAIGDFFMVLKDMNLVSTTLSVAKLTHIFFISNFEEDQGR